jgi:cytochrome c553
MKFVVAAIMTLGMAFSAQADVFVNGDAEAGKTKAASCGACHGADGNSMIPANPKLAGQNASYLVAQLEYFKSGERENAIMKGMASGLSEQDMADIAVFYSEQKVKVGAASETLVFKGEAIYRGGDPAMGVPACTGCHGPQGEGNPGAQFPALSGQNAAYTEAQLLAYRKEARTNPKAGIMIGVARGLSDKDIKAVADYLQGLH